MTRGPGKPSGKEKFPVTKGRGFDSGVEKYGSTAVNYARVLRARSQWGGGDGGQGAIAAAVVQRAEDQEKQGR